MTLFSILLSSILASGAATPDAAPEAARVALGRVCLPGILEARAIEPLATGAGMTPIPAAVAGADAAAKAWWLAPDTSVIAWADGSCTVAMMKGDKDAARAAANREILARPEGFKPGATKLAAEGRVEQSVYCAKVRNAWAVITIAVPGPEGDARTRAFSSTTYRRPTKSPLCG